MPKPSAILPVHSNLLKQNTDLLLLLLPWHSSARSYSKGPHSEARHHRFSYFLLSNLLLVYACKYSEYNPKPSPLHPKKTVIPVSRPDEMRAFRSSRSWHHSESPERKRGEPGSFVRRNQSGEWMMLCSWMGGNGAEDGREQIACTKETERKMGGSGADV